MRQSTDTMNQVSTAKRQLFLDDTLIDSMQNARTVMHQPKKYSRNPVVYGENPWERGSTFLLGGGQVVYNAEKHLFQMWYRIDFCVSRKRRVQR